MQERISLSFSRQPEARIHGDLGSVLSWIHGWKAWWQLSVTSTLLQLAERPVKTHFKYSTCLTHVNKHLQIAGCISFLPVCGEQPSLLLLRATHVCYFPVSEYRAQLIALLRGSFGWEWGIAWLCSHLEARLGKPFVSSFGCWQSSFPCGCVAGLPFFLPDYGLRIVLSSFESPAGPSLVVPSMGPF